MKKVVGIGACVLDTLIECDKYPIEDRKVPASKVVKTGGGPVANALVVLAKLGIEAEFLGCLSNNSDGDFLKNELNRYNVKTSGVVQIDKTSAFTSYILLSTENGSRTCVFERGNVPDDPIFLNFSVIDGADVLHLDGNNLNTALVAAKYAKSKGVLVSLDAGGVYPGVEKLLPLVDILIPCEEFAMKVTNKDNTTDAILTLQEKYNPKILVVTEGVNGGIYMEDGKVKRYDSYKVNCVDSNGAGDTFHGAFISAYLKGYSLKDCCKIASVVAGLKCTKVGMRDALPTFNEALEIINK